MTPARERAIAARTLVIRLAGAMRLARLHDADNAALHTAVDDVCRRHQEVFNDLGSLRVTFEEGVLRVNDTGLADLTRPGTPQELFFLRDALTSRGLSALHLLEPVQHSELLRLLDAWTRTGPDLHPEQLQDWLLEIGVRAVAVELPGEGDEEPSIGPGSGGGVEPRDVLEAYLALLAVGDLLADPGEPLDGDLLTKAQAAVEHMSALTDSAPDLVLFATTYRDSGRYASVHAANTSTLVMLLGRRLGLGHEAVSELGRAGLFCDLGMRGLGDDVRYQGGELDEYVTREVLEHPLRSLLLGLPLGLLDPGHRAQLVVGWEHHTGLDGDGYPHAPLGGAPHLYARMVSVCDAYDALVHDRGDRAGLARPLAIEALYQEVDRRFDREVLFAFFEMLGRYPPGSVVQLAEGSIGLVGAASLDPRLFDRPELFLVLDGQGQPFRDPRRVDLGRQRGEHASRITHTLDDRLFEESLFQLVF
ncbi:MAG: hypothetical protein KDA24_05320 [Deltaproteobacteria bacterium]|nr:hypothetical protein [Deltaproteobacteria bacterium]